MNEEKKTNRWAGETIEIEGLDYAVRHYCDGSYFADPKTAKLWDEAAKANQALVDYLYDQGAVDEGI